LAIFEEWYDLYAFNQLFDIFLLPFVGRHANNLLHCFQSIINLLLIFLLVDVNDVYCLTFMFFMHLSRIIHEHSDAEFALQHRRHPPDLTLASHEAFPRVVAFAGIFTLSLNYFEFAGDYLFWRAGTLDR